MTGYCDDCSNTACICPDLVLALAADLDREPCRCVETARGMDTLGCAVHAETPEGRQWNLDHLDGISAEEDESMARYAYESCREEGCR